MFGDLKTAAGVKALDAFLADNSYIEGCVLTLHALVGLATFVSILDILGMCPVRPTRPCLRP